MNNFNEFINLLKQSKIAIIGAGVSNIPLIKYLLKKDCNITLFDKKELDEINDDIKELINTNKIKSSLGETYLENLVGFDIIFRSPSMLPTNKYLTEEKSRGAIITTEIEQVLKYSKAKTIGITGSKGKTTTTTITNEILANLGYKTHLGGNIGIPLFDKIEEIKKLVKQLVEMYPNSDINIFNSMFRVNPNTTKNIE